MNIENPKIYTGHIFFTSVFSCAANNYMCDRWTLTLDEKLQPMLHL